MGESPDQGRVPEWDPRAFQNQKNEQNPQPCSIMGTLLSLINGGPVLPQHWPGIKASLQKVAACVEEGPPRQQRAQLYREHPSAKEVPLTGEPSSMMW